MRQLFVLLIVITLGIITWQTTPDSQSTQTTPTLPGHWQPLETPATASLRGVCVVDHNIIWASGAEGTVLRSVDGGHVFKKIPVPDAEELDFRDVHGFDENRACLMTAGQPARFYLTQDGGESWKVTYQAENEAAFFDSMAFWNNQHGIAFSDPVDGRLLVVVTQDGGASWQELPHESMPELSPQEHGYAASGTSLVVQGEQNVWIGLGGTNSMSTKPATARILRSSDQGKTWQASQSHLPGTDSAGVFSLLFLDATRGVAVGGDYRKEEDTLGVLAWTDDGGETWHAPQAEQHRLSGFRSGLAKAIHQDKELIVSVGPSGCDWSTDAGQHWSRLKGPGYHAVDFDSSGRRGCAVGSEGRVAVWVSHDE